MCARQSTLALALDVCRGAFPRHAIRRWAQIWAAGTVYKETEVSQHGALQSPGHCSTLRPTLGTQILLWWLGESSQFHFEMGAQSNS